MAHASSTTLPATRCDSAGVICQLGNLQDTFPACFGRNWGQNMPFRPAVSDSQLPDDFVSCPSSHRLRSLQPRRQSPPKAVERCHPRVHLAPRLERQTDGAALKTDEIAALSQPIAIRVARRSWARRPRRTRRFANYYTGCWPVRSQYVPQMRRPASHGSGYASHPNQAIRTCTLIVPR